VPGIRRHTPAPPPHRPHDRAGTCAQAVGLPQGRHRVTSRIRTRPCRVSSSRLQSFPFSISLSPADYTWDMRAPAHGRHAALAAIFATLAVAAAAQQKPLTIDDIYDPDGRMNFNGSAPSDLSWADPSHFLWPRDAAAGIGVDWLSVDARSGAERPLFDT